MNTSIKTPTFFIVALFTLLFFQNCKKASPDPVPDPIPTPVNVLCEGSTALTFRPLKMGNKWEIGGGIPHTEEVVGTKVFAGKTYFDIHYLSQIDNIHRYYRMESNGDVYKYNENDVKEYLELPIAPVVGQIIATFSSGTTYYKVAATNATYSTSSCTYTGLMKIEWYSSGSVASTYYFKKGLGMVAETSIFGAETLKAVTLK